jgi:hypothetical protein
MFSNSLHSSWYCLKMNLGNGIQQYSHEFNYYNIQTQFREEKECGVISCVLLFVIFLFTPSVLLTVFVKRVP